MRRLLITGGLPHNINAFCETDGLKGEHINSASSELTRLDNKLLENEIPVKSSRIHLRDSFGDMLTGLLSPIRVKRCIAAMGSFADEWGFDSAETGKTTYYMIRGRAAVLELARGQSLCLNPGDVVMLLHGASHRIRDPKSTNCARLELCSREMPGDHFELLIYHLNLQGRLPTPFLLRSDNGLVFTSRNYTRLVRSYGLRQEFITPHCPQQNGMVESLIRTLKEQCAHRHRFETLQHAMRV